MRMHAKAKKPVTESVRRKVEAARALMQERRRTAEAFAAGGDARGAERARVEAEAAERALARLTETYDLGSAWNWVGERFTEDLMRTPTTRIAEMIRADIAAARMIAQRAARGSGEVVVRDPLVHAPRGIKVSVRTRQERFHACIDVLVARVPEEWGWQMATDELGRTGPIPSPALREFLAALESIHQAYNADDVDSLSGRYERRYWGQVKVIGPGRFGGVMHWSPRREDYEWYSKPGGGPVD